MCENGQRQGMMEMVVTESKPYVIIPRRCRVDLATPAESKIREAMQIVEELGCDPSLTDAIVLLEGALKKVSDFVDDQNQKSLSQQAYEDILHEQDKKAFKEIKKLTGENMQIEIYQQDWFPGFAAFLDDGSVSKGKAHVCLNLGALMAAVEAKDIAKEDIPYLVAESLMHEIIHALESWAGVEFNEEKVEALLEKYRVKYGKGVAVEDGENVEVYKPVLSDLDSWGGKLIDEIPDCKCGGRPHSGFLGHIIDELDVIPYTLTCDKCMHKIGNIGMESCILKWVARNSPNDVMKWIEKLTSQDADELEGQI